MVPLLFRTPARRPGDKLRQPNQVAVVAPAAEEQKEVAAEATRTDASTVKVAERPKVEAPGKADTVKMGIKVVGGNTNKDKPQVQRYG